MQINILIITNDINIIKSLINNFQNSIFSIFSAINEKESLEILNKENIEVLLKYSDCATDEDLEFLQQIKNTFPSVLRVFLSKFTSDSDKVKFYQRNIVRTFLSYPILRSDLISTITRLLETDEKFKDTNLLEVINIIEGLPTINTKFSKILDMLDTDFKMYELTNLIEQDVSISTRILHISNSAYYFVKTGSIKQAITFLGRINIKSIVLSTAILETIGIDKHSSKLLKEIWDHSYLSNKILHMIYRKFLNTQIPDEASAAGLLHNIGLIFMIYQYKEQYVKLIEQSKSSKTNLLSLESYTFGFNHQLVGAFLFKHWDFLFPLVESALYHHSPFDPNIVNTTLLKALYISHIYSSILLKIKVHEKFDVKAFNELNIDEEIFYNELNYLLLEK